MLILASKSPRRQELLTLAGLEHICIPSDVEEIVPEGTLPEDLPALLALQKAEAVFSAHPSDTVLGSDTIVVSDGQILGKPKNEEDAFSMLRALSGKAHTVYTGAAILAHDRREVFTSATEVVFYPLSDEEIRAYIATGEPMDKAGAYGIQGKGSLFVKEIRGDYYTVVGLPLAEVARRLKAF